MAPISDPVRLDAFLDALGNWSYEGYVQFTLHEQASHYLREVLGITTKELAELMYLHVRDSGSDVIDEVVENREPWASEHEFHHDVRIRIGEHDVYVETRLHYKLPLKKDASWIEVVNVHSAS